MINPRKNLRHLVSPTGAFCCYLLFLLFSPSLLGGWGDSFKLAVDQEAYDLGYAVEYLEDPKGELSLEDVLSINYQSVFQTSQEATPAFGFTRSVYWFRILLENVDNPVGKWLFEVQYPLLDQIEFYLFDAGQLISHQTSGDQIPFEQRPQNHRTFLFETEIPTAQSREIYLRVESSGSMQVPIALWSERTFYQADHNRQILFGLYYGIILAMLVYNLMLFANLRDPIYLYYVGYIGCFSLFQASLNGLAYEHLWPSAPAWAQLAIPFFIATASLMAIQFTRLLLQLARYLPKADIWFKGFMVFLVLFSIGCFWVDYRLVVKLATASGLITSIALNVVGWISWRAKVKFATYYVLSWTAFLLGASIYALKSYALLPENFISEYAIQIGSAMEVLLLSFALAYRVKLLEEENKRIQIEANMRLEQRVIERTNELNNTLEELSQVNAKLEMLSQIDGLTGVYNRSYLAIHYPRLWKLAQRSEQAISVLMIDIDHFKQINDNYGHLCGDEVLKKVVATIADNLRRSTDLLARYGGEEFIVILPHTDAAGAMLVAERVRAGVAGMRVNWEASTIEPRVSIGLASLAPTLRDQALTLIEHADQALYQAKRAGRDRVVQADDLPVPSLAIAAVESPVTG